jgi:hypothetical protein
LDKNGKERKEESPSLIQDKKESKNLCKRKRKTERELKILRSELKKNVMWTRESIKTMRNNYEKDFEMSE